LASSQAAASVKTLKPAWAANLGSFMHQTAASDKAMIVLATNSELVALSTRDGHWLWKVSLPLRGPESDYGPPRLQLGLRGRVALIHSRMGVTYVTLLDASSGAVKGEADFEGMELLGIAPAGDYALCCFRTRDRSKTWFQTVSLADGTAYAGVLPAAKACLSGRFLSFGSELFENVVGPSTGFGHDKYQVPLHVDIPDYTGGGNAPAPGMDGDRSIWFLPGGQRVLSICTESSLPGPDTPNSDLYEPTVTRRVTLWWLSEWGKLRLWEHEGRSGMEPPTNPVVGCDSLTTLGMQCWLYGLTGVFRVTDAGSVPVGQATRFDKPVPADGPVTRLFAAGGKLYGYYGAGLSVPVIREYVGGEFRPYGRFPSPYGRATEAFILPVTGGLLRGVSWLSADGVRVLTCEMYRLPG
jgi:hypothetical protein